MKKYLFIIFFCVINFTLHGQNTIQSTILLDDQEMKIESMEAVNAMYNFKFEEADRQFRWFKIKYPNHPLPYFLLGLNEWWKVMPDPLENKYDAKLIAYMDSAIKMADKMYDKNKDDTEAAFFLAAAYGFKGRLYSEREQWRKAALAGNRALNYLDKFKNKENLSIEFLFGDGLYNYFREWIPENYKSLKPLLLFFSHGDKKKGIDQLKKVTEEAFYTRTEAQYFLMRIYEEEKNSLKAFQLAELLHTTYPDNAYFHRYYDRMLFSMGQIREVEKVSVEILDRLEKKQVGYEFTSGRYAAFYLGYISENFNHDIEKAKSFYKKTVVFAELSGARDSGYYLSALTALGRIYNKEGNTDEAKKYYEIALKHSEKKSSTHIESEKFLKDLKKAIKTKSKNKKK